jgi:AraC-like DNA-binding protein
MESFFFNITDRSYKITDIYKKNDSYIKRVDISNGVVFLDINLQKYIKQEFKVKNLDRMVAICVIKNGNFNIKDNITNKNFKSKQNQIQIYCSSRQDFILELDQSDKTDIFIVFIADFFLKRYLSNSDIEPIDFIYNKIQKELSMELVNSFSIDALSLYIIEKIKQKQTNMNSIKCEHNIIEFMIHCFSLFDFYDNTINQDDLIIVKKAKDYLLKNFASAPTIKELAHICATNETKLKKIFKQVYKITIYEYIQKLRLEEANLLLRDKILNIGEISKKVGYKHQGNFSKLFFNHFGVYPKDLLK